MPSDSTPDIQQLFQQTRAMQEGFSRLQQELGNRTFEASAGGLVTVVTDTSGSLLDVTFASEAADTSLDRLAELIVSAAADAGAAARRAAEERLTPLMKMFDPNNRS
ncbi:YbaB/EbfC family nucleoid-associated protein [Streptomyces shenzhenensis]